MPRHGATVDILFVVEKEHASIITEEAGILSGTVNAFAICDRRDPRDGKITIQSRKDDLLDDSYAWILNDKGLKMETDSQRSSALFYLFACYDGRTYRTKIYALKEAYNLF